MKAVGDVDILVFDQYHWADSDDEDDSGFGELHLRDMVFGELWMIFRKEYWSPLWVIQELAVSPTTSKVHWADSTFTLSTLQAAGDILLGYSTSGKSLNSNVWEELKLKSDSLAFITTWGTLETTTSVTEGLNHATIRD